jgi:hypothetical protein
MKFMWLKATQSSGVILASSNAMDAVWHGQRSVCRSLSPCFLGALRPSRNHERLGHIVWGTLFG